MGKVIQICLLTLIWIILMIHCDGKCVKTKESAVDCSTKSETDCRAASANCDWTLDADAAEAAFKVSEFVKGLSEDDKKLLGEDKLAGLKASWMQAAKATKRGVLNAQWWKPEIYQAVKREATNPLQVNMLMLDRPGLGDKKAYEKIAEDEFEADWAKRIESNVDNWIQKVGADHKVITRMVPRYIHYAEEDIHKAGEKKGIEMFQRHFKDLFYEASYSHAGWGKMPLAAAHKLGKLDWYYEHAAKLFGHCYGQEVLANAKLVGGKKLADKFVVLKALEQLTEHAKKDPEMQSTWGHKKWGKTATKMWDEVMADVIKEYKSKSGIAHARVQYHDYLEAESGSSDPVVNVGYDAHYYQDQQNNEFWMMLVVILGALLMTIFCLFCSVLGICVGFGFFHWYKCQDMQSVGSAWKELV